MGRQDQTRLETTIQELPRQFRQRQSNLQSSVDKEEEEVERLGDFVPDLTRRSPAWTPGLYPDGASSDAAVVANVANGQQSGITNQETRTQNDVRKENRVGEGWFEGLWQETHKSH